MGHLPGQGKHAGRLGALLVQTQGGAPVFLGEFGTYNKTPHPVYLSYTRSLLEQCRRARFGWAMWNLRGEFGVLDSGRADAVYEDYRGHKLDRKMMDLLMEFRRP